MRIFSLVLLIFTGFCILACAHGGKAPVAIPEGTPEFGDPRQAILVAAGQTFSIVLDSNATTGYSWQKRERTGADILAFEGRTYIAPRSDLAGAGGKERFTFKARSPGKENLTFDYLRPWEKNTKPVKTVVFTVEIR